MQSLCTLRVHCRQWPRNTHYQGATPYLGRTSTSRIASAWGWRTRIGGTRLVHLWNGVGDVEQLAARRDRRPLREVGWGEGCARALAHAYRQKSLSLSGANSV